MIVAFWDRDTHEQFHPTASLLRILELSETLVSGEDHGTMDPETVFDLDRKIQILLRRLPPREQRWLEWGGG